MDTSKTDGRKLTLKKHQRLKSRTLIKDLFALNQHIRLYPFKLVWMEIPDQEKSTVEFGVSVSKRNFRTAVKRNLIKRKMREAYRLNQFLLLDKISDRKSKTTIMLIYTANKIISHEEFQLKTKQLLITLATKINSKVL